MILYKCVFLCDGAYNLIFFALVSPSWCDKGPWCPSKGRVTRRVENSAPPPQGRELATNSVHWRELVKVGRILPSPAADGQPLKARKTAASLKASYTPTVRLGYNTFNETVLELKFLAFRIL